MRAVLLDAAKEQRNVPEGFVKLIEQLTSDNRRTSTQLKLESSCNNCDDGREEPQPLLNVESMRVLARALALNQRVVSLTLYMCGIKDEAAEVLFQYLEENYTLKTLNLGWNAIGARGHRALIKMIGINTVLEKVNLYENYARNIDMTDSVRYCEISGSIESELKVAVANRETPIEVSFLCHAIGPGTVFREW